MGLIGPRVSLNMLLTKPRDGLFHELTWHQHAAEQDKNGEIVKCTQSEGHIASRTAQSTKCTALGGSAASDAARSTDPRISSRTHDRVTRFKTSKGDTAQGTGFKTSNSHGTGSGTSSARNNASTLNAGAIGRLTGFETSSTLTIRPTPRPRRPLRLDPGHPPGAAAGTRSLRECWRHRRRS